MRIFCTTVLSIVLLSSFSAANARTILIEAEGFEQLGGWVIDQQFMDQMGSPFLLAHGLGQPVKDATTTVALPVKGRYRVWVRTRDWVAPWKAPGAPGRFQLLIDGQAVKTTFGTEGQQWHWQDGGTVKIDKKHVTLALHDLTGFEGRCDAIVLTSDMGLLPLNEGRQMAEFRRKILGLPEKPEDAGSFDLVVVGGGIAGTCTAVSAARLGLQVALVQDRPVLGGNNSSDVRVHLGGKINLPPYPALGNVVRELDSGYHGNAREARYYADKKKLRVVQAEKNIKLFLNMHAYKVEKKANRIIAVIARNTRNSRELRFVAPLFADCTGDGTIGYLAGADFQMGRESRDQTGESLAPEKPDKMTLGTSVLWYSVETDEPTAFPECPWALQFTEQSCQHATMGNWDWETGLHRDTIAEAEYIRDYLLRAIYGNWAFQKNHSKDQAKYANRKLAWVAYIAGKRESRRLLGDVILKQQDIQGRREFPDAFVTTTWSIDLHYPQPKNAQQFAEPFRAIAEQKPIEPYPIPYRCLYSRNIENLFMAGRDISVTHVALGTVRVMRTCGMMGELVGMAASLCKKYNTTPRGVYQHHLAELKELAQRGVGKRATAEDIDFQHALENGRLANEGLRRCRDFVRGWLKHADPKTGLIPRNLKKDKDIWNAKDSAADNWPFMVLTAALTDRSFFEGRMLDMLRTETKLTSRIGAMPDTYSFSKQGFRDAEPDIGRIIFGSSEYIKDGLLPLTEWLGPSPWCERMLAILDDIWKHAPIETKYGRIPSTSQEVNGEMLQTLCRVFWMTGEKKYLDWAIRLGDFYLLGEHHPTRNATRLSLDDHGCEIISGLCELYATVHFVRPEKKRAYQKPIHEMLDRILEIGRDEHGLFYDWINPQTGQHPPRTRGLTDNWGYDLNGFYTVYLVDKTERYRQAVRTALSNLNEHYIDYKWEGGGADGYADSIEGAINLYNREPICSAAQWIDSVTRVMWNIQKPDGIVEGWHGDGNFARTTIMYCLWKTKGLTIRPWREDVIFGAAHVGETLKIALRAEKPWQGQLIFDVPRHKTVMKMPLDWPRINQFPEWFTVKPEKRYMVHDLTSGSKTTYTAKQLQEGVFVELKPAVELRLLVKPVSVAGHLKPANPKELVKTVADAVLRDFPEPPPFDWGEGVLMAGMMQAYKLTKDERYLRFVRDFADYWYEQGIEPILRRRGYCGHWGPGFAMLMLYEATADKRYLALAERINRFMLHEAERTKDGGLSHFYGKPQLWVDTLYMCCPTLSHLARITNQPKSQQEAVRQLEIFAKHLQDPQTGLFYHMWDEGSDVRTPSFWARGNGWIVMSYIEVLRHERPDSPARARLVKAFGKQLASIVQLQDEKTGLWHTVLDAPDTYLETSASAMFLYGIVQCRNLNLLKLRYAGPMRKAWAGLASQVDAEGRVIGVSSGTGPGAKASYAAREVGTYTWGTGALLMAACAYAEMTIAVPATAKLCIDNQSR
ncbi:MAG: glycoside hydrolase family 88 protein [Sedimentisphaerales bacterium]